MFIITLKLFEGEDFATILRVLNLIIPCTLSLIAPSDAFIQEESHNFSLINMTVVRIDLNKRLDLCNSVLGKAFAIDTFEHLDKLITINYALINLLIILLKFGEHFVHFLFDKCLKAFKRGSINQSNQLLSHLRLTV